jgi:hypothetical protein
MEVGIVIVSGLLAVLIILEVLRMLRPGAGSSFFGMRKYYTDAQRPANAQSRIYNSCP